MGSSVGPESGARSCGPPTLSLPRLARSTLTLVPLLGVHEVVFAPVTEEQAEGSLRFAKLAFEIFLSSFQVLRLGAGPPTSYLRPFSPSGHSDIIIHWNSHY